MTRATIDTRTWGRRMISASGDAVPRSSADRLWWSARSYGSGRSQRDEDRRDEVRAGVMGQPDGHRDVAARPDEFRPDDGADRRSPDHDTEGRRPAVGWVEVGGGVPR